MAKYNPLGQTAISGLRGRAAEAGLENSPFALTSEAGLRGQLANQAVQDAFGNALQTSIAGANIIAGGSPPVAQSPWLGAAQGALNAYALGGPRAISFNFNGRTPYYAPSGNSFANQYPAGGSFPSGYHSAVPYQYGNQFYTNPNPYSGGR